MDWFWPIWKVKKKSIGKIFLAICDFLKVYTVYVNNYSVSFDTLRIAMTNKHFQAFLEKQKLSPESNQLDFASFLIMPIQRIPRYVLLLQDLFKHTRKSHPDYVSLKSALEKMRQVAGYVNEKKREKQKIWIKWWKYNNI